MRAILRPLRNIPPLPPSTLAFLKWESLATLTSLGTILKRALPRSLTPERIASFPPREQRELFRRKTTKERKPLYVLGTFEERLKEYTKLIGETLKRKGQALVLAPSEAHARDIAERLTRGEAILTSRGGTKRERTVWFGAQSGEPGIYVGGKGALRLPFSRLDLIILDDEMNPLWKETREHPYTDGRVAARALSRLSGARIVIGSTFPSLSFWRGPISSLRRNPCPPAETNVIDLRTNRPKGALSPPLREILERFTSTQKEFRAIIFVNRLGTAPSLSCADCRFVFTCAQCAAPLPVFTKAKAYELRCRHCGEIFQPPLACPSCRGLRLVPKGIATEGLERVLARSLKDSFLKRLDSIATPRRSQQRDVVRDFSNATSPAILIATSMAFQHRIPPLDLVVIASFEQLLATPNFSAEEDAFATITRLREMLKPHGTFIVQTWHPDHPLINDAVNCDVAAFAKRELTLRKTFGWPPFSRLAKLTFAHENEERAEENARRLREDLRRMLRTLRSEGIRGEVLGPTPALIPRVRGKFIFHVIVKWNAEGTEDLRVEERLFSIVPPSWNIDIFPQSIL